MEMFPAIRDLVHSLAVLPIKAPLQVVSPTVSLKCTVRRLRLQSSKKRPTSASTYNAGEDIATAPVDSEVNDAHIMGMLASPLYTQETKSSADLSRIYHSDRKFRARFINFPIKYRETCRDVFTHKKVK